ncbi:MAG: hypothetical protein LBQ51_08695, partial [Desulfovibrio sp.]|nr:hypothetical protein [Desulfovibrio sp.]
LRLRLSLTAGTARLLQSRGKDLPANPCRADIHFQCQSALRQFDFEAQPKNLSRHPEKAKA